MNQELSPAKEGPKHAAQLKANDGSSGGASVPPPPFQLKADGNGTPGGNPNEGTPTQLPEGMQGKLANTFNADFSNVQLKTNSKMAESMGAKAFARGNEVQVAPGHYNPESKSGQELLGHEYAHIDQQANSKVAPTTSLGGHAVNDDKSLESDADRKGAQVAQAKAETPGALQMKSLSGEGPIQGDFFDWLGDTFNMRENEAELDRYEDYEESYAELLEFITADHTKNNFFPSTGIGKFDVSYDASVGVMTLTCKSAFNFIDGDAGTYGYANAGQLTWTDPEKEQWKNDFLSLNMATWSRQFTFWNQREWWERMKAEVVVNFIESNSGQHFNLNITKIPRNRPDGSVEFARSSVGRPSRGFLGMGQGPGTGTFDSNDLTPTNKGASMPQLAAVHEAGHMLGLGDEYETGRTPHHNDLVHDHFDTDVNVGSDDRIMSGGDRVDPEHGVVFLEALQKASGEDDWGYDQKPRTPAPIDPRQGPVDHIPRDPNGPQYA